MDRKRTSVLVCNIGWMTRYEGLEGQPDKIVGGGSYVVENEMGHECCNFLPDDNGRLYGHVETSKKKIDREIKIEKLGASRSSERLDHVTVIWVATDPRRRGRYVVGVYLDACVHRARQHHRRGSTKQHRADGLETYVIQGRAAHAFCLPPEARDIELGSGPGWVGQVSWWYPHLSTNPAVKGFLQQVEALIDDRMRKPLVPPRGSRRWGAGTDAAWNALVEDAANDAVRSYYAPRFVDDVAKENRGWDLEVYGNARPQENDSPLLKLEVKGLSAAQIQLGVTPNEYRSLCRHMDGNFPEYRLCVLTGAFSARPKLAILRYHSRQWYDDVTGRPTSIRIEEKAAAIISGT